MGPLYLYPHDRLFTLRNFAKDQLIYFRPRESFHWINVAPGNHRIPMETLADVVTKWFIHDHPIPLDIDGTCLKQLVSPESHGCINVCIVSVNFSLDKGRTKRIIEIQVNRIIHNK